MKVFTMWTIYVPAYELRYWSGRGEFTDSAGTTFTGAGELISISQNTNSLGEPENRLTISMVTPTQELRTALMDDEGPVEIRIRWYYSTDGGTWLPLPTTFVGRLSRPSFSGTHVWTAEIETYSGDVDRGVISYMSHETQTQQYPNDKGFEFMRSLAQGIDARWPP